MRMLLMVGALCVFALSACDKDKNRRSGVCYCEFVSGDPQEYDLTDLSRSDQIDQCYVHSTNAAHFGGSCELE